MKIFCVSIFLFILHVEAQRRIQTRQEITNPDTSIRGRGRSRFSNTETEYARPSDTPSRRIPSRRKQEPVTPEPVEKPNYPAPLSSTQSYAVEEVIDEGDATPKLKALPEPDYEPKFISSQSPEADNQSAEIRGSAESSGEKFSEELGIPTVKFNTDKGSIFREDVLPKVNEKPVPITRNNVRSSGNTLGGERRVDVRNGGSKSGDRGSRNGNSRNAYEQNVHYPRGGSSRSRSENNISSPRPSVIEDSGPIMRPNVVSEIPPSKADSSSIANKISDPEDDLRKEIVRNSVPNLPSPIGVGAVLSEPSPPKKTIKKTLRTRVNTNSNSDEIPVPVRGRFSQRVEENFETVPRVPIARTVEEYTPSARGRSSEDIQSLRSRSNTTPKTIEVATVGRSRTRATRRPTEAAQIATVPSRRNGRRRTDTSTTSAPAPRKGPSVFSAHEESPPTRSRTGRRIEPKIPKAQNEQNQNSRTNTIRGKSRGAQISTDQLGSSSTRKQNFRSRNDDQVTKPSRQRFNPRSPLNIDESKLEVLPLFEGETKIISELGRKPNQLDELMSTVTDSGTRVMNPPEIATPSILTRSDVSTSSRVSSVKVSRRKPPRKTEIRETVISQVTEVTSKRTITRKPVSRPGGKRLMEKKPVESKLIDLTRSEENISDSDNYPEPFKALIQSKKQVKESRPSNVPAEDTKTKKIVNLESSSEAPRSVLATPNEPTRTTTYPIKYGEDSENEVHPKTSTTFRTPRPTKKRVSLSLKNLELKNKKTTPTRKTVSRSTLAPAKEPKEHKFHSKFNAVTKNNAVPTPKPFNSSAAKGLSFNRKGKDGEKYSINKTRNAIEIGNNRGQYTLAPLLKSSRYSSRYRSSGSSRSAPRTSTAPPAYIPTIPSIRSYSSTVKPKEDPELGIEYITFDVPSRSISSANLIKGDYQASEDANSNSLDSKQERIVQTTEKPVSIIERIINSITGINITTEPTNINFVAPTSPEPTKSSAILSLAPKKTSEKSRRTDDTTQQKLKSNKRDAATSEKPTTIIQRILDSLSAIQAATTTETTTVVTTDTPKQVGTNFNTLSARTTTPSQLDLETASFSSTLAPSTTINPLVVLDTISDEQVLQKRTIGKLLDILNSLTTQHPDSTKLPETTKLVYVTPKLSNYLYATPSVTPSGTLKTLNSNNINTDNPITSTQSSTELFTSMLNDDSTLGDNRIETTTTDRLSTTSTSFTSTDAPLSISLGLSSTPDYIEDNILFSTTPRSILPIMNIKSLLALNGISNTALSTSTTTITEPSATSLFTPSTTSTINPSATPPSTNTVTTTVVPPSTSPAEVQIDISTTTSTENSTSEFVNDTTNSMPPDSAVLTSSLVTDSPLSTDSSTSSPSIATDSSTMPESALISELTTVGETNTPEGTTVGSTDSISPYFSTIPTFPRFEVSPDSVSIFSANDLLSNSITPDDFLTSTIAIPAKISDNFLSIGKTTYSTIDDKAMNSRPNAIKSSEKTTNAPVETSTFTTQRRITNTPTETFSTTNSVDQQTTSESTTLTTEDNTTPLAVITETSVNTSNITPPTTLSSTTPSITNGTTPSSERMGKLLQNLEDEVANNIDSSYMGPDYFVFAVLPNNTILRKRPHDYNKETPFVIVGVYPNNTIIRKYLNGTLVPMEPVIRVSGFDTRANPPPLPDITSNQVTPDQGNEMDNPKLEMVSTPPSSVNSLNSTTNKPENIPTTTEMTAINDSTTVESDTLEESTSYSTVIPDNIISSSTLVPSTTLPSISELLNGKTVQAYNSLVNNTSPNQDSTTKVEDNAVKSTTITASPTINTVTPLSIVTTTGIPSFLSTLFTTLQSIGTTRLPVPVAPTTQGPFRFSSTYRAPLSTNPITTTIPSTTIPSTTRRVKTTTLSITTTVIPTTTVPPTTTTMDPTTPTGPIVFRSSVEDSSTPPPFTSKPAVIARTGKGLSTTVFPYFNTRDFPLLSLFSTERPRRTSIDESTKIQTTTTTQTPTTVPTTTSDKIETTSESLEELLKKPIDSIKPKRKLTEQQKQDLETIRRLEQDQAAILKQLSLLTNLNLNNFGNGQSPGNLANRILSLAKERDSRTVKSQTPKPTTTTTTTKKTTTTTTTTESTTLKSKSEVEAEKERMRQIESLIKLLNMNGATPSPEKETTYGTSNDAILAGLLRERGIGPSTPKEFADQLENSGFFTQTNEVTSKPTTKPTTRTTRKPKPTTQPTRGPILQRLNWLLDAFAPPPTKAPARKPKTITTKKPKPKVVEEDILMNEPTHITPVVSPPPNNKKVNSVSQDDIQKLIKQLEAIQKDPSAAKNLDLTSFKNLESLNKDNVQVFMPGSSGVSERETTRPFTRAIPQNSGTTTADTSSIETTTAKRKSGARAVRTSTFSPTPVSNSIIEDVDEVDPTPKGKATIPPVRLRPVSGVSDDAGSMVRGRLLSAAVNVTRAISGFLGSAFQNAASSFQTIMGSGSRIAGTVARGSSTRVTSDE